MADTYPLWDVSLKHFPHSAIEELADILEVPNGGITLETFAEEIDRLHHFQLELTNKVAPMRFRYGQRATQLLFDYLRKRGVTVGEVQFALDNMQAATSHIFRKYYNDIVRIVSGGSSYLHSSSPSEHQCRCQECRRRRCDSSLPRPYDVTGPRVPPTTLTPRLPSESLPNVPTLRNPLAVPPGSDISDISSNWYPPECVCGDVSCDECERRRLLDQDQTVVLSHYYSGQNSTRNRPIDNDLSQTMAPRFVPLQGNINDEIQEAALSYTENPSVDLRSAPDGISQISSTDCNRVKRCTCKKIPQTPTCTCRRNPNLIQQQMSVPSMSTDSSNRWSNPEPDNGLKLFSPKDMSSSDPEISHKSEENGPGIKSICKSEGLQIFISYTDDVKAEVIQFAGELKQQGFKVNTDIQKESYYLAKDNGLVSEKDQYSWLANRYKQSDFIIVCTSKGYLESLNMQSICPSSKYINAKYIYELITNDLRNKQKTIEVCFTKNVNTKIRRPCLPFAKQYSIPNDMFYLISFLRGK